MSERTTMDEIATPVTAYVRESYAREKYPEDERLIEIRRQGFDRWLDQHDEALRFELLRVQAELQKSKEATASVLRDLAAERGRIASSAYHQKAVENARREGVIETVQRIREFVGDA